MKRKGRPSVKVSLDPDAREALERVYKSALCAKDKQKAQVLLLATDGLYSYQRLGEIVQRSRATVINWFKAYFAGGLDELLGDAARSGRPSVMKSAEIEGALAKGLEEGSWAVSGQVREWLREQYGIERSGSTVRYWLGKLGGAHKVPRPVHAKKDEALAEDFKAHLYEKLAALGVPTGARVRVWAADEARYGLHDRLRRCWSLRGRRTVKRMQMDYEWGYAFGAIDVIGGESEFLLMPSVNLGFSLTFLRQIAAREPDAHHVVIWDNAGFHQRPDDESLPANVWLLPLPAYSPELNPIERLWEIVRDRVANTVHGTIAAMDDAVAQALKDLYHAPDTIRSLVGIGWLHLQANASSKIL
jgi:transposase